LNLLILLSIMLLALFTQFSSKSIYPQIRLHSFPPLWCLKYVHNRNFH
jgi:hypothetical protein